MTFLPVPWEYLSRETEYNYSASQNTPSLVSSLIIVFTTPRHLSLSWTKWIQSTPTHPILITAISILSSQVHVGLPSGLFPSRFPNTILYAFPNTHACYMHRQAHPSGLDNPNTTRIWWEVQITNLRIMQFSSVSCSFFPRRSTHSPQHPERCQFRKTWVQPRKFKNITRIPSEIRYGYLRHINQETRLLHMQMGKKQWKQVQWKRCRKINNENDWS